MEDARWRPVTEAQQRAALDWTVSEYVSAGWRQENRSVTQAAMVRGAPPNHVVHAILTVCTCMLWGPVWLAVTIHSKVERVMLTVDELGRVHRTRGPS